MTPWAILLCAALVAAAACSDSSSLPPHGEVVIVVDTDMPVPRIVDHLRIDVYSADGKTWLSSRDVLRPTPSAWPTSFSIYTNDDGAARDAIVRLRAYGGAYVEDYRGEEQIMERPAPLTGPERLVPIKRPAPAARGDCTRYLCLNDSQHADVTPPTVPIAALAIDRLVSVHVYPGVVRTAAITLKGNCVGTPADLAGLRTCVDTEATLTPLTREPLIDGVPSQKRSLQGSFETPYQLTCKGTARAETGLHDSEVCIPGGVFVFGARYEIVLRDSDAYPERMVILPSFFVDKYEFSVGRLRHALANGYSASTQFIVNNGPANDPKLLVLPYACTMSDNAMGREDAPLNCVTAMTARDLCGFEGGDLPTEAQWEYVATVIGRDKKALTPPYGPDGLPSCTGVAIARDRDLTAANASCRNISGYGTAPVTFGEGAPLADESFGIVGLSAGVSERTLDAFASLASNCWSSQPMLSPTCVPEANSERTTSRGSQWREARDYSTYMIREGLLQGGGSPSLGFRCVRSAL